MPVFAGFVGEEMAYCGATRKGAPLQCSTDRFANYIEPVPSAPKSGTLVVGPEWTACSFSHSSLTCFYLLEGALRPAHSSALARVRALAAGKLGWFALDADGRVWMFDVELHESMEHQLVITEPVLVPIADAVELGAFAGDPELCVRDAGGAIRCITRTEQGWSEVRVEIDHGALELDAGIAHACARIDADEDSRSESIHCWGDNRFAQLGRVGPQVVRAPTAVTRR
jgi:hypothetical protein